MTEMYDRVMSVLRHGLYASHPALVLSNHRSRRRIVVPQDSLIALQRPSRPQLISRCDTDCIRTRNIRDSRS
jgi:hypothetical protein